MTAIKMLYKRLSIWNSIQKGFQRHSQGTTDQNRSVWQFKILSISDLIKAKQILKIFGQFEPIGPRTWRFVGLCSYLFWNLLKVAFTCLGTGDEGSFYSDSAAQIAIQEVCNFLRTHLNSKVPVIDQVSSSHKKNQV